MNPTRSIKKNEIIREPDNATSVVTVVETVNRRNVELIFTVPTDKFLIDKNVPAVNPVIGSVKIRPPPILPEKITYKFEYVVDGSVKGNVDVLYAIYAFDPE